MEVKGYLVGGNNEGGAWQYQECFKCQCFLTVQPATKVALSWKFYGGRKWLGFGDS